MGIIEIVRQIKTLDGGVPVYRDSDIYLQRADPNELRPTSKYIVRRNIENLEIIRKILQANGQDLFDLRGIVQIGEITISPPIVEGYEIIDGLHRIAMARRENSLITVVKIDNPRLVSIGEPIEWEDVALVDEPPKDPRDRRTLKQGIEDTSECLRRFYRDFSVLGSMGRRPTANQHG